MESYMLVLYVTLQQEEAIRDLFNKQGWKFMKMNKDIEVAVIQGDDVSDTNPAYTCTDYTVDSKEESSIYLKISCVEEGDNMKCTSTDAASSHVSYDDIVCSRVNNKAEDINFDRLSNENQNISIANSFQDNETVTGMQGSCIVNGIQEISTLTGVQDSSFVSGSQSNSSDTGIQDCSTENCISCNSSEKYEYDAVEAYRNQDNNVNKSGQAFENVLMDTACNIPDIKQKEQSQSLSEQEQKSREQLKNLISRGKLLSIENRKRLNSERKAKTSTNRNTSCSRILRKKRPIFCADCKVTFTSQKRYDTHKERNNGKCVFECEICDKVFFYRKSRYDLHVRSAHSKERPYKCDVCQKGYVTSDKLKIHKRVHTGEKPCVCEECGKAFYSRGELSTHREYHHISKKRQDNMTCDICNMTFCNQRYLAYHKNVTHSTRRDFHCQICFKSFKTNSSLRRHLKYIHSESKNFKCDTCDKSFKTAGSLKKHKVRHVGERTFFCSDCNKGFYEKAKLDQHYRTHTGEKPYNCHLCEYKCALSGNLSKHMKTHYRELTNAVL